MIRSHPFFALLASIAGFALGTSASLAGSSPEISAGGDFARDVLSGRASILIVGDSTNNPAGAGLFCPYYEGLLRRLPEGVPVSGFRVSGSSGNIGVGGYVRFLGGSTNVLVNGRVESRTPSVAVAPGSTYIPPGLRNDIQVVDDAELPDGGRFASLLLWNIGEISPNAGQQWIGHDLVMRTPVVVGPEGSGMLDSIGFQTFTDYDAVPGDFAGGAITTVSLGNSEWDLQALDAVFQDVPVLRFGVRLGGDLDNADAGESAARFSWCHQSVFSLDRASQDQGLYLDSVSVGGFTAFDHVSTLQSESMRDYVEMAGRLPNWIVVWLGENIEADEWDGFVLSPLFASRIEAISDLAIAATQAAQPSRTVRIALVVPPQPSGTFPAARYVAFREALRPLASKRDWALVDLHGLLGNSLAAIDATYTDDDVHPTLPGSEYVADVFYAALACWRIDMNGDGVLNFFDVADYLSLFQAGAEQADLNGDRLVNFFDVAEFIQGFSVDCD